MQNPDASQRSELDWSGFLHFLHCFEPVQVLRLPGLVFLHFFEQVLEPWVLKTCTGSKNAKNPNLEAPNLHRLKKIQKMQNPDASQRSELDWSGFLHFLHCFEPVQVLRLPGLVFLHFFEQVLEPWVLKTCTGSKKCKKIQTWKLQNLHRLKKIQKNAKPRCKSEVRA